MHRLAPLLLAACTAVDTEGPWLDVPEREEQRYAQALADARAEQGLTGMAMAIADHRRHTLWVGAEGLASVDPETRWQPTHRSRMGSVSKTFTAALIHQLADEGALSLDDPLEQWVSGVWTGVRVEDLLGHSSGIVSYNYVGNFDITQAYTPTALVDWAWQAEPALRFDPGSTWEYSNTNYVLLGLIAEAAAEAPYETLVAERFTGPLGLDGIAMAEPNAPADLVDCFDEVGMPCAPFDPSFGWAAGGFIGSAGEIARWNDALYLGEVLDPETRAHMVSPRGLTGAEESDYGLGAFSESEDGLTIVGHTGGMSGYLSFAYTLEDPPMTLVVLTNQHGADLRAASQHGWLAILE